MAERLADGCFTAIRMVPAGVSDFFFFLAEERMMSFSRALGLPLTPAIRAALAITCWLAEKKMICWTLMGPPIAFGPFVPPGVTPTKVEVSYCVFGGGKGTWTG